MPSTIFRTVFEIVSIQNLILTELHNKKLLFIDFPKNTIIYLINL